MYRCLLCDRPDTPLDDAVVPCRRRTCICLACYLRACRTRLPVSPSLRAAIEGAMAN